jgi:hypothetical protein
MINFEYGCKVRHKRTGVIYTMAALRSCGAFITCKSLRDKFFAQTVVFHRDDLELVEEKIKIPENINKEG